MYPSTLIASRSAPGRATAGAATAAPTSTRPNGSARRPPLDRSWRIAAGATLALILGVGGGCQNPCDELADIICGCAMNRSEQASCNESVSSSRAAKGELTEAEMSACSAYLETCTCAALDDGAYQACGYGKATP